MQKRQWAEEAAAKLQSGEMAQVRPTGSSMLGRIGSGDLVTLKTCRSSELAIGDVVLARIKGRRYFHIVLHLIVERDADNFLIGNNHGRLDGWIKADAILGKVIDA